MIEIPVERFRALEEVESLAAGFLLRIPGVDVQTDRTAALRRLAEHHDAFLESKGLLPIRTAEQVHGAEVAVVDAASPIRQPAADGLVTATPGLTLVIYVADCCAVYLLDPVRRVIGLVHSGRAGTAAGIASVAVRRMMDRFSCCAGDLVAQLSPCIRPPFYEMDFAAVIREQLQNAGIKHIFDEGQNTGADLSRYYSYRMERGKTGRMLAYLRLADPAVGWEHAAAAR